MAAPAAMKKLMDPNAVGRVSMPTTRVLYTVIKSPFVHKSSREQFETRTKKHFMDMIVDKKELHQKLFWLKRMRLCGAQFEIEVASQTRLDKNILEAYKQGKVVTNHQVSAMKEHRTPAAGVLDKNAEGQSSPSVRLRIKVTQYG